MPISSPLEITWHSAYWADDVSQVDGQLMAQWDDVSGNARHATQATAAAQPRLLEGRFNGRNTVRFRGTQYLATAAYAQAQPWSVFVVGWLAGSGQLFMAFDNMHQGVSTGGSWFGNAGKNLIDGARTNNIVRFLLVGNGLSSKVRINTAETAGDGGTGALASTWIGAAAFAGDPISVANGEIAFIGIKAGAFTATEITDLEAWATDYYDLGIAPRTTSDAWSWWTRPRAVAIDGKTYVGTTSMQGDVIVNEYADVAASPSARHIIATGLVADEHNSPAVLVKAGQPPIVMWQKHQTTSNLHWKVGTVPIESGMSSFGSEQTRAAPAGVNYSAAHIHGDNIHVLSRIGSTEWHLTTSTDWGTTFGAYQKVVSDPNTKQMYVASRLVGDRIRMAASTHPSETVGQSIYYAELDVTTGTLYKSDGTVIGSIGAAAPAFSAWEVAAAPVAGYRTWVYDVSDAADPEIVWSSMDSASVTATSKYHYSRRTAGAWASNQIVSAGARFGDATQPYYLGGAQLAPQSPGGVVYTCREAAGLWYLDKHETADGGATWTTTLLKQSNGHNAIARAWPVEAQDATPTAEVAYNQISYFASYSNMDARVALTDPVVPPSSGGWWDGAAVQPATLLGWWDGAAVQPATLLGWWDGAAVQPVS